METLQFDRTGSIEWERTKRKLLSSLSISLGERWNHAFTCLPTLCNLIQDGKSMGGSYRRVKRKRMQIRYFRDDVTSKDFERNRENRPPRISAEYVSGYWLYTYL